MPLLPLIRHYYAADIIFAIDAIDDASAITLAIITL